MLGTLARYVSVKRSTKWSNVTKTGEGSSCDAMCADRAWIAKSAAYDDGSRNTAEIRPKPKPIFLVIGRKEFSLGILVKTMNKQSGFYGKFGTFHFRLFEGNLLQSSPETEAGVSLIRAAAIKNSDVLCNW